MKNPYRFHPFFWDNHSGMALLIVLSVMSVLLILGFELAKTTGRSALTSGHNADGFMAKEQSMAGIHLAVAILTNDAAESETDSVQEDWARPEKLARAVQNLGYSKDDLILEIRDELGKIQINSLIKEYPGRELNPDQFRIWKRFFDPLAEDPEALANCLKDWLDSRDDDAVSGLSGAESDYYLSLDPPYRCTNGPFTHISEIFMVKGITPDLFRINQDDPEPDTDLENIIPENLITVHGIETENMSRDTYRFPGKININTAPPEVLRALLPLHASEQAEELASFRKEKAEGGDIYTNSLDKGWVTQVIELSEKEKSDLVRVARYDSDLFSVRSQSTVNQVRTTLTALIHRTKDKISGEWSCRILQIEKDD